MKFITYSEGKYAGKTSLIGWTGDEPSEPYSLVVPRYDYLGNEVTMIGPIEEGEESPWTNCVSLSAPYVSVIGENSFINCNRLQNIYLPEVIYLYDKCFWGANADYDGTSHDITFFVCANPEDRMSIEYSTTFSEWDFYDTADEFIYWFDPVETDVLKISGKTFKGPYSHLRQQTESP